MSTNNIVPTPDQMQDPSYGVASSAPTTNVSQTPPQQAAPPAPSVPAVGPRLASTLGAIVSASTPAPAPAAQPNTPPARPAWQTNLGKVASVVSTGLSGIPAGGRPSFLGGLGQGARAEQQAQATESALKFKDFQSQVQAAQLHNEDVRLQNATEDHQNTVQDHADAEAERMTATTGMSYTKLPNTAENVATYLKTDAAQNGAASVPAGIIMGPHSMYIPNKGSAEQAQADTKNYNLLAGAYRDKAALRYVLVLRHMPNYEN